jgi:hypothetical protein
VHHMDNMIMVFLDVKPCSLVVRCQCFKGTCCLQVPLKHWYLSTRSQSVTTQKPIILVFTMRILNIIIKHHTRWKDTYVIWTGKDGCKYWQNCLDEPRKTTRTAVMWHPMPCPRVDPEYQSHMPLMSKLVQSSW